MLVLKAIKAFLREKKKGKALSQYVLNFNILTLLMSDCEKELLGLSLLIDFMISLKVLESFISALSYLNRGLYSEFPRGSSQGWIAPWAACSSRLELDNL